MADPFAFRLSLLYGTFFAYTGLSLPFMPAWLAAKGLDARDIGIVLAAPMVVRVVAVPLSTRLADRVAGLRPALVAAAVASVAGFALVGLSGQFVPILATYTLAAVLLAPVLPLTDAYALRGLRDRTRSYGSVRLWGSVTFIVANLGGGVLLARLGAINVIWVVTAALALNALAALALVPLPRDAPEPTPLRPVRASLWRVPAFAAVMLGASLIQASHAVMYGFGTVQWGARGIDGTTIGMLWAIGVVAEIVLFALSARVVGALGATGMIVLGGAGGVLRWAVMAFDPPTAALPPLQALHALSFGATHLGAMHLIGRAAPAGRSATTQGDFVAVQGVVFAAVMSGSGVLVETYGSLAYGAMAACAAAGGLLAGAALGWERRASAA